MDERQIQAVRNKAFEFGSTDSRHVAALRHLADAEKMYRSAHAAIDKARRELQSGPLERRLRHESRICNRRSTRSQPTNSELCSSRHEAV
jgi:hypothetical protein